MKVMPASVPIVIGISTYLKTSTPVVTASIKIANINKNRKGFVVFNNSSNSVYITYGETAVAATCTRILATFNQFESFSTTCWTGEMYAIRNSGSGQVTVWEFME